jgi:hypothetical protein
VGNFSYLKMVVVVVVQVDIQKMDSNFDKDLVVVDKDFVDNHYLLKKHENNIEIIF